METLSQQFMLFSLLRLETFLRGMETLYRTSRNGVRYKTLETFLRGMETCGNPAHPPSRGHLETFLRGMETPSYRSAYRVAFRP